jgi:pimeloyl-[acyl-carrier protein] methyl ester esterase
VTAFVLLHGWGTNPGVFDALRLKLASAYDVQAPALPGHTEDERCTLDDLAAAIAAAAPQQCDVGGWSLGGQVALAWARAKPQQVRRVVLFGTTARFVQSENWHYAQPPQIFEAFAAGLQRDHGAALERFISLQVQGDARARHVARELRAVLERGGVPAGKTLEGWLNILRASDLRGALATIEQDVLVIHGEHDGLVPVAAADFLAAALPHGRLEIVRGAAHAPFISAPAEIARLIFGFLG